MGIGELVVGHIGAVDLELELVGVSENSEIGGVSGGDVLNGMVKVHLLDLGTGSDRLLDLSHDHVLGLGSEHLTLLGIEVGVVGVDVPLVTDRSRTPGNAKLDIMVLKGDEGESRLPVLTEGETERVKLEISGTTKEVTRNRFRRRGGR